MILIKTGLKSSEIENFKAMAVESNCEFSVVSVCELHIIVIVVYRAPNGKLNVFFDTVHQLLNGVMRKNKLIVMAGDFNTG